MKWIYIIILLFMVLIWRKASSRFLSSLAATFVVDIVDEFIIYEGHCYAWDILTTCLFQVYCY